MRLNNIINKNRRIFPVLSSVISVCFLLVTGLAITNPANAESVSKKSDLKVDVGVVIALAVANCPAAPSLEDTTLTLTLTPVTTGTFKSDCVNVGVSTNAPGYSLLARANSDDTTNNLTYQGTTSITPRPYIPPTSASIASPATISPTHWGFAVENLLNFDTTYTANNASNKYSQMPITDTLMYKSNIFKTTTDIFKFFYGVNVASSTPAGTYLTTVTYTAVADDVPPVQEEFKFTIDTRMYNTPQYNSPTQYNGTATSFAIPTNSHLNNQYVHSYDWVINCGGGQSDQIVTGASAEFSTGIICNYATPGEYQITIRHNSEAPTMGWMDAFGFRSYGVYYGSFADYLRDNKSMFKSIDTPFTNNMRTQGSTYRFAEMFDRAVNASGIPKDLFTKVKTNGDTDLSYMFLYTFYQYALFSTTATIPSGLFSSLNTSNATNLNGMFSGTFDTYAVSSISGTIPSDLFSSLDTSSAISMVEMFHSTFDSFALFSTTATIPSGLFSSLDTSSATDLSWMFTDTFSAFARNSVNGTIPADLFSSINTNNADDLSNMFYDTFCDYAQESTIGTIPASLFATINTSNATNLEGMFDTTFAEYADNNTTATIPAGLFDTINTNNATKLSGMYRCTFCYFAMNSTVGTIPNNLFKGVDTSSASDLDGMFWSTFVYYALANKANDATPDTDINSIWGNANLSAVTVSDAESVFRQTFRSMPSLVGLAQTFINNKLGGINPTSRAYTFDGTSVTDLASLNANWK